MTKKELEEKINIKNNELWDVIFYLNAKIRCLNIYIIRDEFETIEDCKEQILEIFAQAKIVDKMLTDLTE